MVRREIERGELWEADLDPIVGHEQGGRRPVLILSIDPMNRAPAELVLAVAMTTTPRENLFHVRVAPEESGLPRVSYAMPEMVRMLSHDRLRRPVGKVPVDKVEKAAANVGILLGLGRSR